MGWQHAGSLHQQLGCHDGGSGLASSAIVRVFGEHAMGSENFACDLHQGDVGTSTGCSKASLVGRCYACLGRPSHDTSVKSELWLTHGE